jgi:hypothetical protein
MIPIPPVSTGTTTGLYHVLVTATEWKYNRIRDPAPQRAIAKKTAT